MRSLIFHLSILVLLPCIGSAQEWAGPDTATCGRLGVIIGSNDPCLECCYLWAPATGLDCTDCKNPTASPSTEQDYTVTVVDKTLRVIGTDQVHVGIEFGEIAISPDFLLYGIDASEVIANVTKPGDVNEPNEIEWDFVGDALGCMIVPQGVGAKVTPGSTYGKIVIEARKVAVEGCDVSITIPVNNGVKDVIAIDPEHIARRAHAGETLYVISHEPIIIHALPNAGGFKDGVPDWKADIYGSNMLMDGDDYETISQEVGLVEDVTSEYIAGDPSDFQPKVTVVRKPAQTSYENAVTIPALEELLEDLSDLLKFKDQPAVDPPCGSLYPFSLALQTPTIKLSTQNVEKYNSPKISQKVELALEVALEASGRLFHPVFTKSFTSKYFNVTLCSRLYIELTTGLSANIKVAKDPSMADSLYHISSPEIVLSFGVGGGAEFAFQPAGFLVSANAKISSSAKCTFTYSDQKLMALGKINPLSTKVTAKIQSISNMGEFEDLSWGLGNFSYELELIPAQEFGPYAIYNFQN